MFLLLVVCVAEFALLVEGGVPMGPVFVSVEEADLEGRVGRIW